MPYYALGSHAVGGFGDTCSSPPTTTGAAHRALLPGFGGALSMMAFVPGSPLGGFGAQSRAFSAEVVVPPHLCLVGGRTGGRTASVPNNSLKLTARLFAVPRRAGGILRAGRSLAVRYA